MQKVILVLVEGKEVEVKYDFPCRGWAYPLRCKEWVLLLSCEGVRGEGLAYESDSRGGRPFN
jgi:hypothetical protein